jgi:hypothetical protein
VRHPAPRAEDFWAPLRRAGDHVPVRTFVWVDSWQQQCCGDEFRVGSTVRWDVFPTKDEVGWVDSLLGPEWGARVGYWEDHHGGRDDRGDGEKLEGAVRSIHVVTCERELKTGVGRPPGGVWVPVPGSGRLRQVESADPWEPEPSNDDRPAGDSPQWLEDPPPWWFEGWIVEVDADDVA